MAARNKKRRRADGTVANGRVAETTQSNRSASATPLPPVDVDVLEKAVTILAEHKLRAGRDFMDQLDAEMTAFPLIEALGVSKEDADALVIRAGNVLALADQPAASHLVQPIDGGYSFRRELLTIAASYVAYDGPVPKNQPDLLELIDP